MISRNHRQTRYQYGINTAIHSKPQPMTAPEQRTPCPSPLAGKRVLVTRAIHQSEAFAEEILRRGATVAFQPAIEIVGPESWAMADSLINNLNEYSRMVFVSTNAVEFFIDRAQHHQQLEMLKQLSPEIIAIGSSTKASLESNGLSVAQIPANSNSQSLADLLIENPSNSNTVIFRGDRGSDVLGDRLAAAKVDFEELAIYRSQDVLQPDPDVFDQMMNEQIHWTTITSSAIGNSVANLFGDNLHRTKIATISPTTTDAMERLGFSVSSEARRYDLQGMLQAMESFEAERK